jgi:hypothetical protein
MPDFRKDRNCPSSYELSNASQGSIDGVFGLAIASHLAECDFCAAEVEFYQAYPPGPIEDDRPGPEVVVPPIPLPLRELAESLLAKKTIHISTLDLLLSDV